MSDFKIVSLLNSPVVFATGVITASAGTQTLSSGSLVFSNSNNVTFGMNGGTITASASIAGGGGAAISAGTNSTAAGTVVFSNSNGVTFGMNTNGVVTATVKTDYQTSGAYLTTARASNDGIGLNTAQSNVTWTANSNGLSIDARGYAGTVTGATNASITVNSNGVSLSVAAPVTTAGLISAVNVSAGTTSNNLGALTFGNGNGVTFGLDAGTLTASVATNYQSQGAYLTTARASNDGLGLNTAQSNVTWTANSAGLSLDGRGYAGTGTTFGGTNISGSITQNSNGINLALSVAPGGGGADGYNIIAAGGSTAASTGTIVFSNSNGVSFGLNGATVTATVATNYQSQGAYLTTARASNDAVGLNTAQSNVTWTVNSAGLSLDARGYAGTVTGATNASVTVNSNGVSVSVAAPVTTNGLISAVNVSAGTTSNNLSALTFNNSNGVSFGLNGSVLTATVATNYQSQGAYLTTAMASNRGSDFVAATAAFNGTNISGTIASNAISLSVAAPGAAAENNWVNLLGANTAGDTTASGSTIGWSAGNGLTLSATNGSQVVLSVGPYITTAMASNRGSDFVAATAAFNGTNASGTIASNGISVSVAAPGGAVALSGWANALGDRGFGTAVTAAANSLVSIRKLQLEAAVDCSAIMLAGSINVGTAANNSSAFFDLSQSVVLYTRNGASLSSILSASRTATQTWSSNATGTITGMNQFTLAWNNTTRLDPGEYWLAVHHSTANSATGGAATTALGNSVSMAVAAPAATGVHLIRPFGSATNASYGLASGQGIVSTNSTMGSIGFSVITGTGSRGNLAALYVELRNY